MTVPPETQNELHSTAEIEPWDRGELIEELLTIEGSVAKAEDYLAKHGREQATYRVLTFWGLI